MSEGDVAPGSSLDAERTLHESLRVKLLVIEGPHKGAAFEFNRHDTFVVGRSPQAQLCLSQDRHFSRHHLRIEIRPPECLLIDLDSRNGTFVNDKQVTTAYLNDGDIISGGDTEIQVVICGNEPPVAVPTPSKVIAPSASKPAGSPTRRVSIVQSVPGYELLEELGEGTMGVVYRAAHKGTGRTAAVKLIIPRHALDTKSTQLFIREASVLRQLQHPHIVESQEFGFAAGQFFLVMEYVPKIPLDTVLAGQSDPSRLRICCGILCQILEALEYAHGLSIVHRDVKPENILLWRRGRKLNAKLSDFGLAKNYENAGFSELTRSGEIRGTIAYMPPEQIIDCRYARPTADIYAAGATLYRIIAGTYPFEFTVRNKFSVVLEDAPVPIEARCAAVPKGLAEIVHRALAKDPEQRYPSAEAMRQALLPFSTRQQWEKASSG